MSGYISTLVLRMKFAYLFNTLLAQVHLCCQRRLFAAKPFVVKHKYVPRCDKPSAEMVKNMQDFLDSHKRIVVITGAGISTESGIPDYRSEDVGLYARKNYKPMQYQDFIRFADRRQRYWARSYIGWPGYSKIQPAVPHKILYKMEQRSMIDWIITQNVDHLHHKSGSERVTELHGTLYEVSCLLCKNTIPRQEYQKQLEVNNPAWGVQSFEIATDGDVFLSDEQVQGFQVPACTKCGGDMMPRIVFFGDNVPRTTVQYLYDKVKESDAVLVLGSSLQVYSAYRFVLSAAEQKKPIAIVNIGSTRGDKFASLQLQAQCGELLSLLQLR